jgi:hypothetical protein
MIRFVIVAVVSGILFGILDGLINANPLAQKLYDVYRPIAKTSINVPAGILIDLVFGFVMAGAFLILFKSLPGHTGLAKGIGFAVLVWFFRVAMQTASSWIMFKVPIRTLIYSLCTGFVEMLVLGIFYGLMLRR